MVLKTVKSLLSKVKNSVNHGRRNLLIRKFPAEQYKSIDAFLNRKKCETELATIWFNKSPLDILFQFNDVNKPLFVFFHGAVDQEKTIIPHFVGLSYKRMLPANLLHVAEPSLVYNTAIRSAWFLGSSDIDLPNILKDIVTDYSERLGNSKIIFFGSSGGGYPALYMSQLMKNSLSIVNSPATSISNHPRRKTLVSNYLKYAFDALTEGEENQVIEQLKFADLQHGFDNNGKVLYMININDRNNITHHAEPFFEQFENKIDLSKKQVTQINNIHLCMDDWGPGHRYPPASLLKNLFLGACSKDLDWQSDNFNANLSEIMN